MKTQRFLTIGGLLGGWLFVLSLLAFHLFTESQAATITTIAGTDTLTASRSVINTNFSNLNAALFDWTATGANGAATTSTLYLQGSFGSIQASSTSNYLASTTILGSLNVGTLTATSGTSYLNALSLGTALSNANLANSSLTITPSGILSASGCAPVSLGGTCTLTVNPNLVQLTVSATKFLTGSTTNLAWLFQTGFVSSASSTLSSGYTSSASSTQNGFFYIGNNATTSGTFEVRNGQLINLYASTTGMTTSYTVDWNNGATQRIDLIGTTFLDINSTSSHPYGGGRYALKICQGGTAYAASFTGNGLQHRWFGGMNATTSINTTAMPAGYCIHMGGIYDERRSKYDWLASSTPKDDR